MTTTAEVMEFMYQRRAPNLRPDDMANVLGHMIWTMDDNGAEICQVLDQWLLGDDVAKVCIALAMDETYPCGGGTRMKEALAEVSRKWPQLQERCEFWLKSWNTQFPERLL